MCPIYTAILHRTPFHRSLRPKCVVWTDLRTACFPCLLLLLLGLPLHFEGGQRSHCKTFQAHWLRRQGEQWDQPEIKSLLRVFV
jgi:hypothetical protein